MRRPWQAIVLAMVWSSATVSLHAEPLRDSLVGKWKHTSGQVRLTIEDTRLHFTCEADGHRLGEVFSLHTDYSTRDQSVFGLITRVGADEFVRHRYGLDLLDEPICFRVRVEDSVLVIHDMKNIKNNKTRKLLEGVYKPDAAVAADKAVGKKEEALPHRPHLPTPVPSCGLYGNRLDNFALYDVNGGAWEYKRDHHGRLTLLDFWYHNCGPCLQTIHDLVELQKDFGPSGLEVIGIACETGPVEEQRRNARAIHERYGINYTTLLSGGGPERCPVMEQFQVEYFPLLVLIAEDGTIRWRSTRQGMDEREHYKLRKMISEQLAP
jgi:thiol-disulfide isomerase/thioredoxin